jgi:hypothetical protein
MPKFRPLPPLERLNEVLEVVKIPKDKFGKWSGLVWKVDRSRTAKAGSPAGNKKVHHSRKERYDWQIMIDGVSYYAARVIYYMVYKEDPGDIQVDHEDRNPYNNNPENLRLDLDKDIQQANQSLRRNNQSGISGVTFHKRIKKWQAYLTVKGEHMHLGYFLCKIEAAKVISENYIFYELAKKGRPLPDLNSIECGCVQCTGKRDISPVV